MLDLLAIIKQDIGDLDRIVSVERLHGFVRSAPTFIAQPEVIDGASDLLVELLGPAGRHARTATGVNQLPFGAAVQLDLILRLI
jgi:enamine deaminase RidA (YjgF/YER057c/UK114 family)